MSKVTITHIELNYDKAMKENCGKHSKDTRTYSGTSDRRPKVNVEPLGKEPITRKSLSIPWPSTSESISSGLLHQVAESKEIKPKAVKYLHRTCNDHFFRELKVKESTSQSFTKTLNEDTSDPCTENVEGFKAPCNLSVPVSKPDTYIGNCRPDYKKMAAMNMNQLKFYLSQDPRKKNCIKNPEALHYQPPPRVEQNARLTKKVREADNICEPPEIEVPSFVCEVIDVENPLGLDFQGLDYQNTYKRDEQDLVEQYLYKGMARHMDRARVRREATAMAEEHLRKERAKVPDEFLINDWAPESPVPSPKKIIMQAELFRATEKPGNKERLAAEAQHRRDRYKDLYLRKKERDDDNKEKQRQEEERAEKLKGFTTAIKQFHTAVTEMEKDEKPTICEKRIEKKQKKYPHTVQETQRLKKKMKQDHLVSRDIARVKKEFFKERVGKDKDYPEADLELSSTSESRSEAKSYSTQETDGVDEISLGRRGSVIMLRGFHDKLSKDVRGKDQATAVKKERRCMTREEWMQKKAPRPFKAVIDIEKGIRREVHPDHPQYELFPRKFGMNIPKIEESAVRQYIRRRLGLQYYVPQVRTTRVAKPRLPYTVKKFNMINHIFGEMPKLERFSVSGQMLNAHVRDLRSTEEYRNIRNQLRQKAHEHKKRLRLKLLGIPCPDFDVDDTKTPCEVLSSSSSSSEWVPAASMENVAAVTKVSRPQRGNMPAPIHRETTLRSHPRHPRHYAVERVPSQLFSKVVQSSHFPHLHKMAPDKRVYANVNEEATPYVKLLEGRHHHDYWDPTQIQEAKVLFQPKVVHAQIDPLPKEPIKLLASSFKEAEPVCNAFVKMDLTHPAMDIERFYAAKRKQMRKSATTAELQKKKQTCQGIKDYVLHTRDPQELEGLDYPGRKEYLQFLHELHDELYNWARPVEEGVEELHIDKQMLITDLEDDLRSIASCLTSLSSSVCTNLSNDSGSIILVEGKTRIPLDYIRKSVVPFEELKHSRFQVEGITVEKDDKPFKIPENVKKDPFAKKKDNFFTFTTRLYNNLRLRLEAPVVDVRKAAIGYAKKKFPSLVATDFDERYVDLLNEKNAADHQTVRFKSDAGLAKDVLRLRYESMLVHGQVVRFNIWESLNAMHLANMKRIKKMIRMIFHKWRKRVYDTAMAVMHQGI